MSIHERIGYRPPPLSVPQIRLQNAWGEGPAALISEMMKIARYGFLERGESFSSSVLVALADEVEELVRDARGDRKLCLEAFLGEFDELLKKSNLNPL
ncbi:hypothetical protein A2765_01135 [Candidatus Kaiserbacteria bacterium RIFCSPHIGHO2_01_FULL_56_24]|uniref:Uncharacterized protein n=1 Tax=Candidatus Kaiserbacteria bacterium RIFCSPHIGHO2_01_FULL_56_24 TaxID=1798487 RepID=A0A1F6DFK9_9BACT|nr:MAG: hypothetical protein A2765_01135 [Candidatus Kaiserbacteria bacterium RIFCSPHIGHO2_01_FULL_56_24]